MKHINLPLLLLMIIIVPCTVCAQSDTSTAKKDTITKSKVDTAFKAMPDTAALIKNVDTTVTAVPMNCYKQWLDYFTELGAKPLTDGTHPIVIAFKTKESCHCYMGKVEVTGGKMKAPVYVETTGGEYKTFTALGKKLDPDFLAAQGAGLWEIVNGMSVLFQTTDNEYGRIFFYKSLNKNKQMNKEAPSPSDLLKN